MYKSTQLSSLVTALVTADSALTQALSIRCCCRDVVDLDGIDRTSMACPAMPTCGLAVTESERSMPDVNVRIRALMSKLGFDEGESFVVRMTGAAPGLIAQMPHVTCGSCYMSASLLRGYL